MSQLMGKYRWKFARRGTKKTLQYSLLTVDCWFIHCLICILGNFRPSALANDFIIKVWNIPMSILNAYFWNKIAFFLTSLITTVIHIVNIIARENNKTRNPGYDIHIFWHFLFIRSFWNIRCFFLFVIELLTLCTYRGK